jgi:hypothetical protein
MAAIGHVAKGASRPTTLASHCRSRQIVYRGPYRKRTGPPGEILGDRALVRSEQEVRLAELWEARPVKEYEARSRNYPAQLRWRHGAGHNSVECKRTRFRTIAGGTTSIMAYLKTLEQ